MENQLFNVKDKVIIITGGGGALGGTMAGYLAQQGAKIVIISRKEETVQSGVDALKAQHREAIGLAADVLDEEKLKDARDKILEKWGRIDVLINGAGGHLPGTTIAPEQTVFDVSFSNLQKTLDLNLMGSVLPTLVFGKVMADQTKGSIINISSMAATHSITRVLGYSMAKAGIDIFTKWMAMEMARKFGDGIRVNAIAPGFFIGNQNRRMLTNKDDSLTQRGHDIIRKTPMGRFGEAEELNGVVHYLCSDASQFVTGTIIPVDGGFSSFSGV